MDLLQTPPNSVRYWLIHTVRGKGRKQTASRLCTVASATCSDPHKLARDAGFQGPFHAVEMTRDEYAADLKRVFH